MTQFLGHLMRKIRMRIFHIGQHHEFYNAEDIYDLCFALALASTSIGEFDVSAFCIDVGANDG